MSFCMHIPYLEKMEKIMEGKQDCCSYCSDIVFDTDEHIENIFGDVMHIDCAEQMGIKELVIWVGGTVYEAK